MAKENLILECTYCKALVWYSESSGTDVRTGEPTYTVCCQQGRVKLPPLKDPPDYLQSLPANSTPFRNNIRVYNSMLAFTSVGASIDHSITSGNGPPAYRIHGQLFHRIGSLIPMPGKPPQFLQMWIVDTDNEVTNRMKTMTRRKPSEALEEDIITGLTNMLDENNYLSKFFRKARDLYKSNECQYLTIRLVGQKGKVGKGLTDAKQLGKRIILPSSFTGGPRYMIEKYHDAMAICRTYGNPNLFITMTANPNWPDIKDHLTKYGGLSGNDRPDIVCRVFKMKLDQLFKDLEKGTFFSPYIAEFQKRGLPHAHMLLWLENAPKIPSASDINAIISAELPNKTDDPVWFALVERHMMHGPCGKDRPSSPCMSNQVCSKKYPRRYTDSTTIDKSGYIIYRRRQEDPNFVLEGKTRLDNRFVIPHNIDILKKYESHINVEWCNTTNAIKYLFKYITKGVDKATVLIEKGKEKYGIEKTMFTEWMGMNAKCPEARKLLDAKVWHTRKQGDTIGRIITIHPYADILKKKQREFGFDQKKTYDAVLNSIDNNLGQFFFLNGAGGTAPMSHRRMFEALDRTLRDILSAKDPSASNKLFGGITVLLGGDFRQILPVIPQGTRADTVLASISQSYLWNECSVYVLHENMRLQQSEKKFAEWLVSVGDGTAPKADKLIDNKDNQWEIVAVENRFMMQPSRDPLHQIADAADVLYFVCFKLYHLLPDNM
ncbi:unnamed protein product [Brassica oleracea]